VAAGLGDRQPGTDRGGQRLLDELDLAGARRQRRVDDGALLDLGDARGTHMTSRGRAVRRWETRRRK
jgi:hypothetical protein